MHPLESKPSNFVAYIWASLSAYLLIGSSFGIGIRLIAFNPMRLLAAFAGIGVAVTVMFVELGLLTGLLNSQALMASVIRGELVVMNEARTHLHKWDNMSPIRINQIAAAEGVEKVIPVYQSNMGLRDPETNAVRRILVVAFPPEDLHIAAARTKMNVMLPALSFTASAVLFAI